MKMVSTYRYVSRQLPYRGHFVSLSHYLEVVGGGSSVANAKFQNTKGGQEAPDCTKAPRPHGNRDIMKVGNKEGKK
jgi:hypothetical protein